MAAALKPATIRQYRQLLHGGDTTRADIADLCAYPVGGRVLHVFEDAHGSVPGPEGIGAGSVGLVAVSEVIEDDGHHAGFPLDWVRAEGLPVAGDGHGV